jgi:nucleoside 2-deoxyribosyltransferase
MILRVYLAGPDVFMPDPAERAAAMKQVCARHGLLAISPLDLLPGERDDAGLMPDPRAIALRNEAHIRRCDALLANLTPFRGPGADAGTVYEVGYGRALGRPVFGYATIAGEYAARVRAMPGSGSARDAAGLAIEDFGLFENLMISCGIEASGGFVLTEAVDAPWADLSVFERCVTQAAATLRTMFSLSP